MSHRISQKALILLVFTTLLPASLCADDGVPEPQAISGVLDLRGYDFAAEGPLKLAGEWGFHWDAVASSNTAGSFITDTPSHYVHVPSYWDDLGNLDTGVTAQGVATYSLRILKDSHLDSGDIALKFLNITPNAAIFLNGRPVAEIGNVDPEPVLSRPGNRILLIPVSDTENILDLIVSISNFHNVNGGLNRPIHIGLYNDILITRERLLSADALFLGGLMLMGLYQLSLFLLNRKRKAPIFMAVLCFLAFFFSGFKNEMVLLSLFPAWDGEVRTKFIYLALTLSAPTFVLYAYNLYPSYFRKSLNWIPIIFALLFSLIILITPKSFYTRFILPLEIMVFASGLYTIVMLVIGFARNRYNKIPFYLIGLAFLLASIIFSVVDNEISVVFQSAAGVFFVFILYQAFLQAYIFSSAFTEIDHLSYQKSKLEKRNVELFSLSYIDSLTETCNRRLMDDFLISSWRINTFNGRSVGMILIDLDEFSNYNKYYGHRQGDSCLIKVSELVRDELAKHGQYTLARYGGDQFAVIVSDMDEMTLFRTAESLRIAVEKGGIEHPTSTESNVLTVSIGCAYLVPEQEIDPETILDATDAALHQAKKNGRNRTVVFNSESQDNLWVPRLV